jgi:DNA-binding transcriptional ArsR family regulator
MHLKEINQILLDPIRSRIIQFIAVHQLVTAGELALSMPDVPKTTLYRHLGILHEHAIIKVVAENRIRGSVERTYALDVESYAKLNTMENMPNNAFGFLMNIYADFYRYFTSDNPKPAQDHIFMSNVNLLLTDKEFGELFGQINALLKEHLTNAPNDQRKQRSISFISSPSREHKVGN